MNGLIPTAASGLTVAAGLGAPAVLAAPADPPGAGDTLVVVAPPWRAAAEVATAGGVDELTSTFGGLDRQTKENAALASESAEAAADLDAEAARLAAAVDFFKEEAGAAAPERAAA
ncbi:MAG: hypothetical protein AAF322_11335 [Pseudomonadota bacterium]